MLLFHKHSFVVELLHFLIKMLKFCPFWRKNLKSCNWEIRCFGNYYYMFIKHLKVQLNFIKLILDFGTSLNCNFPKLLSYARNLENHLKINKQLQKIWKLRDKCSMSYITYPPVFRRRIIYLIVIFLFTSIAGSTDD